MGSKNVEQRAPGVKYIMALALPIASLTAVVELGDVPTAEADPPPVVDTFREQMLVDPRVVNAHLNGMRSHNGGPATAAGPWSFRGLMEDIGRQVSPGEGLSDAEMDSFLNEFLGSWLHDYALVSGSLVKLTGSYSPEDVALLARDANKVRATLLEGRGDGFAALASNGQAHTFELWRAPFELIAIVNRGDLSALDGSHGGELRFVFALKDQPDFTIILEYQVPTDVWSASRFAREWHRLGTMTVGSDEFLQQLELITSRITKWQPTAGVFPAIKPSRLAHVRSNEIAFAPDGPEVSWELREFRQNSAGELVPATTFNTPNHVLFVDQASDPNDTDVLAQFVNCYTADLLATQGNGTGLELPEVFDSCPADPNVTITPVSMLSTHARAGNAWASCQGCTDPVALRSFGMLTCNGCHQDNKHPNPMPFLHVNPVPRDDNNFELMTGRGRLSLFLSLHHDASGNLIPNAACADPDGTCFELERRAAKLQDQLALAAADVCNTAAQCAVGQFCVAGECQTKPAHCHDYQVDETLGETGPDCGGPCGPCGVGITCFGASDCEVGKECVADVCVEP